MWKEAIHRSNLLLEYKRISVENTSQKVEFYKTWETEIDNIPVSERIDVVLDFLIALFHSGDYNGYLSRCNTYIDALFDSDLFPIFDKNKLQILFHYKAACQFNLFEIEKSYKTLLSGIQAVGPYGILSQKLLVEILIKKKDLNTHSGKGIIILSILTSAVICILCALVFEPFYHQYLNIAQGAALFFLSYGLILWTISTVNTRYKAKLEAARLVNKY